MTRKIANTCVSSFCIPKQKMMGGDMDKLPPEAPVCDLLMLVDHVSVHYLPNERLS